MPRMASHIFQRNFSNVFFIYSTPLITLWILWKNGSEEFLYGLMMCLFTHPMKHRIAKNGKVMQEVIVVINNIVTSSLPMYTSRVNPWRCWQYPKKRKKATGAISVITNQ